MKVFLLLLSITLAASAYSQHYEFIREGSRLRFVETPIITPPYIEDTRPFWQRVVLSTRPWFEATQGANLSYEWIGEHTFALDGGFGVGLQAKVDF